MPDHGFESLERSLDPLATVPASEVVRQAATLLMNASAEKLGLTPGEEPDLDLAEVRQLITALAGLLSSVHDHLAEDREPLLEGLRTLQNAFREASAHPDAPGEGPGEHLLS